MTAQFKYSIAGPMETITAPDGEWASARPAVAWEFSMSGYGRCGCDFSRSRSADVDEYSDLWLVECQNCGACWEMLKP